MTRQVILFCACGLLSAGVARAGFFDPANCECTNRGPASLGSFCQTANVYVTGNTGGVADPVGEFCVTVRDFNNAPIANSSVVIDFSQCDLQLCANQLDPGVIVDCALQTVGKLTDVNGEACFRVQGKSRPSGSLGCGGAAAYCVRVFADGQFLCAGDAPTFDLVGQGGEEGLNPNDLSEFLRQWLICATNNYRCNYDCSNRVLDPIDLSYFLRVWLLRGGSTTNCAGAVGPKCP
ncbi:MAG TPA: hypothetical protein VGK89_02940 [Candidatus Eisenbacteria bacterium]|jgi:hypothetical protein